MTEITENIQVRDREETRLIIKIDNHNPIELTDLTKSLYSLASHFADYVEKDGRYKEEKQARLFVKEIKSGSVIVELVELSTVALIPFVENFNTVLDFAGHLKNSFTSILNGNSKNENLDQSDFKELSAIVNPIAKDKASQINFSTTINGNVVFNFNLNSTESNAIQNIPKNEIEKLKEPTISDDIKEKVVLVWFQARGNLNATKGNKGVIEELSKKELNVIFEDDKVKETVLHSEINPFTTAFVVDVKIINIEEKPAFYKVVKLHEYYDLE
jgi:hypothetical protein